ncbi:MAG TPA: hypothetical protein VMH87_09065 [Pseudomonadales bacterium]|nr:hypothetical protein [Pseudomonadales bacterium]
MSGFSEADIDLERLFLPAWAQEKPGKNPYEKFSGEEKEDPRRDKRRGGFSPDRGGHGQRPRSPKKFGDKKDFRRGDRHDDRREHQKPEPPAPLPDVTVSFMPDEKGVEQIARQIKVTGRAYPLFQIAHLVLQKPERYSVRLSVKKKADGTTSQPLFLCALDDSPWLSEDEAVAHVLKSHFATFYQAERTATEPPKGTYTFVAQCGMSGVILGPPNYHDYQNQLRKLHAERFSRMPFDVFKSRVKIVKDEAVVKKWIEDQSFKTEYICLNVAEPLKLASMEEVEKHFRATHKEAIIKPVETLVLDGVKSRNLRNRDLQRLVRVEWENQKHFPLQLATSLSKQFASHGLQFFKVNKTVVHVSVARPQFLDLESTPVSENIKRIVEFVNANPRCNRRKLIESLSPTPKPAPAPAAEAPVPVAEAPAPAAEGDAAKPAQPAPPKASEPTPEQTALIADLHWLVHQGHVLEFADGRLETAKKPLPRPPKPEKKPAESAKSADEAKPAGETQPGEEAKPAEQSSIEVVSPEAVQSEVASTQAPPPEEVSSPS